MGLCGGSWLHPGTAPSRWRKPGIQLEGLEQEGALEGLGFVEQLGAERRNEGTLRDVEKEEERSRFTQLFGMLGRAQTGGPQARRLASVHH